MQHLMDPTSLTGWENFYVIIGSSAAALTGLQFVVIVLGAEGGRIKMTSTRAFATPTVVHFCGVLLMSAIISAPWQSRSQPAVALTACGIVGLAYVLMVIRHTRKQGDYAPVFEDWLWHSILPLIAYLSLSLAAIALRGEPGRPLFVIAGSAVLLLFIGIHNAWDAAIYIAIDRSQKPRDSGNRLGAVSGDQARADTAVVDAHEKPRGKDDVGHDKRQSHRERRH